MSLTLDHRRTRRGGRHWSADQWLARGALVLLALAAFALVPPSLLYLRNTLQPELLLDKDFSQEYLLARAFADRIDPYVPLRDLAQRYVAPDGLFDKALPTPHPPTIGLLMLPVAAVDYADAAQIWFGIQVLCLVLGVFLLLRSADLAWPRMTPLIVVLALGWAPAVEDLALGQLTLPLLVFLSGALLAFKSRRHGLAGALLGLSLLMKPLAWPWLLLLAWRREWSSLLAAAVVGVIGFGVVVGRNGAGVLIDYITRVLPSESARYAADSTNISLWTLGPRLFGGVSSDLLGTTPPLSLVSPDAARLTSIGVPLLVVVAALGCARSARSLADGLGVITAVAILVNPISWQYNLVLALIPAARVLSRLRSGGYPRVPTILAVLIALAGYLTVLSWYELGLAVGGAFVGFSPPVAPLAAVLALGPSYAVAGLALLLAWISREPPGSRPPDPANVRSNPANVRPDSRLVLPGTGVSLARRSE